MKAMSKDFSLAKVVMVLWLVSAGCILFFLSKIDGIVHGELYKYNLQFSTAWAEPYWILLRLIYIVLAVQAALSVAVLLSGFWKRGNSEIKVFKQTDIRPSINVVQPVKEIVKETAKETVKQPARESAEESMLISCPKCKKVFGRPLNMLDFSRGRTRLVNVCPYCNHILGSADDKNSHEIRVKDLSEEVVEDE